MVGWFQGRNDLVEVPSVGARERDIPFKVTFLSDTPVTNRPYLLTVHLAMNPLMNIVFS